MYLNSNWKQQAVELARTGLSWRKVARELGKSKSTISDYLRVHYSDPVTKQGDSSSTVLEQPTDAARVLLIDIETSPLRSATWGLWQQNVGLEMIETEWFILSYSAKWLADTPDKIMYKDMRGIVDTENDTHLLDDLWKLLDEADVVIGQNSKRFDTKKINARLIMNGYKPPSPYKQIDTLHIAKAQFGFTSNKLAWMTDKLCTTNKKLTHSKFSGFVLWKEMLLDNPEAWDECELYNKMDVLSLEELYLRMAAWDGKHPNFNLYTDKPEHVCRCGSKRVVESGFAYTAKSKFQQYRCLDCGATTRNSVNLFDKDKRASLHSNVLN